MHMVNDKGEAVYYNLVRKNNKDYWLVQGIGSSPDSFVDLAGYAACAGEIATKEDSNV